MKIYEQTKTLFDNYMSGGINIVEGLEFNQAQLIKEIEFATNSQYLSGKYDDLKRYKPYYNIINFRLNVATRATDLDVKDITIVSDRPQDADKTKVLRKESYEWMKKQRFGQTLNRIGRRRAKYGGVVVKKTEKNGELIIEPLDWRNLVTDEVDVMNGAVIERHFLSPIDLAKKMGVWDNVEDAIKLAGNLEKKTDRTEDKIEVWEVHGEFPKTLYNEAKDLEDKDGDEYEYTNQMYMIACSEGEPVLLLYCEEEKGSPFKYLAWAERDGATLGMGLVEEGLEAQRVVNNYVIAQYNAMELAGKSVILTTSDTLQNNALVDVQSGDIWKQEPQDQTSVINLAPASFPAFQNLIEQWDRQYERASSTYEAMTGETMPSGTPFRSVAIQNTEASSIYAYRLEEFGLFIEEIMNDWVLPHIVKKLNKKHILNAGFSADELEAIDKGYATRRATQETIDAILNGKQISSEEYKESIESYQARMGTLGENRFLDIPDGYYKDFEGYATVLITNEKKNKAATLESLSNILLQVAQAPQILQDPTLFKIFAQIVELSGADISPVDLRPTQAQVPAQPQQEVDPMEQTTV